MNGRALILALALALLPACSSWQRQQVSEAVVQRLECPPEHVVVKGPARAEPPDGAAAAAGDARVWRGACDLWWDERVVVRCDRETRECVVLDVGAPHPQRSAGDR